MLWQIYLRKDKVYVPTVAQTEAGFYTDIEPVIVVPAIDSKAFQGAVREIMAKGNPIVPTPTRASFPKPVILKYANVNSWSAFEKGALHWTVVEKLGNYQIKPSQRRQDRGWEEDPKRIEALPEGATLDEVARRVVALVQENAT